MPCNHKFINDLELQYVDWEVRTLFIGTFNPGWKACENNYAVWFYGRTGNNEFWCILPNIHEQISLLNGDRIAWINFCKRNHLAITDVLKIIEDADEQNPAHRNSICKFKDDDLANFTVTPTDIPAILERHISIRQICITRQTLPHFWAECFIPTFTWIENNPQREIEIRYLRSPSRGARRGVVGNFCDFIAGRWINQQYQIL